MIKFLPQKFSKNSMISRQSSCFVLISPAVPSQSNKKERRKTLSAQNFCRFFFKFTKKECPKIKHQRSF